MVATDGWDPMDMGTVLHQGMNSKQLFPRKTSRDVTVIKMPLTHFFDNYFFIFSRNLLVLKKLFLILFVSAVGISNPTHLTEFTTSASPVRELYELT